MDWKQLTDRAKDAERHIEDAGEVKHIVGGPGTTGDKFERAMQALREPGAHHDDRVVSQPDAPADQPVTTEGEVSA